MIVNSQEAKGITDSNMARFRYSFNTPAKVMGCFHAALGGLLIVMGIVARIQVHHWTSEMLTGIWTGIVVSL